MEKLMLQAIRGEELTRPPIWIMRQAGRVLPEYRALRKKVNGFIDLVTNPHLAAEVTLQPITRFDVDAAIIFSDILVIPEAMGLPYVMEEGRGPLFPQTISSEKDIEQLTIQIEDHLTYVAEALRLTKRELPESKTLIGFAGAPWTIFCYMVEGKGSKTFSKSKALLYSNQRAAHSLLEKITKATIRYLKMQVASGAEVVQVFDSWAGILGPSSYKEFALPYLKSICQEITEVPITLFAKGAHYAVPGLAELSCQTIGLDWTMDPKEARQQAKDKCLQGNMDPCVLYGEPDTIRKHASQMIKDFGVHKYIANLGHGLYPDMDYELVKVFVDAVIEYRA